MNKEELIKEVNRNFKIKINGRNYVGPRISEIVGFEGLSEILNDEGLAERICSTALETQDDVYIRKLRRGLVIRFYVR